MSLKDFFGDPKRWVGWALTSVGVMGVLYFFGDSLSDLPFIRGFVVLATVVFVDFLKDRVGVSL